MLMSARRTKHKNPWILIGLGALCILPVIFLAPLFFHESLPARVGVVIVSDPMVVCSFDLERNVLTAVRIPPDIAVDLTRGYGTYPVSSLWKLDRMDKRQGALLMETMEEALGIPLRYYREFSPVPPGVPIRDQLGRAFSFSSFFSTLFRKQQTNIPSWLYFAIRRGIGDMNPSNFRVFDLSESPVFFEETRADGSTVRKIDLGKWSLLLGTYAEDTLIRKENLRISIVNSTDTPGLAQKLTRVLETLGYHIRSIGNLENVKTDRCTIRGNGKIRETHTVKTLLSLYRCSFEADQEESQNDGTFIIGADFEKRYISF